MKRKIHMSLAVVVLLSILAIPFVVHVKIACSSQYGACPSNVLSDLEKYNGKSFLAANLGTTKSLKSDFLVSEFSTQFKLPGVLAVNVLIKKPIFAVSSSVSGKVGLVDYEGEILSYSNSASLSRVIVDQELPTLGAKVSASTLTALKIIFGLNEMYQTNVGEIRDGGLVVDLPAQIRVLFPLDEDSQVVLGALRLIYSKVTTGDFAGKYSEIDLRFKNPVLR